MWLGSNRSWPTSVWDGFMSARAALIFLLDITCNSCDSCDLIARIARLPCVF